MSDGNASGTDFNRIDAQLLCNILQLSCFVVFLWLPLRQKLIGRSSSLTRVCNHTSVVLVFEPRILCSRLLRPQNIDRKNKVNEHVDVATALPLIDSLDGLEALPWWILRQVTWTAASRLI